MVKVDPERLFASNGNIYYLEPIGRKVEPYEQGIMYGVDLVLRILAGIDTNVAETVEQIVKGELGYGNEPN